MRFPHNLCLISALALLTLPAYSQARPQARVLKISVSSQGPIQLQVQTSIPVAPQAQVIPNPERLIIDIPGALPGSALRGVSVTRNEVKRIRGGLYSTAPPITRIVIDMNSPESYRITPVASGFTVSLRQEASNTAQVSHPPE